VAVPRCWHVHPFHAHWWAVGGTSRSMGPRMDRQNPRGGLDDRLSAA